jgi:superoxide dismutase, Cu-Zn family
MRQTLFAVSVAAFFALWAGSASAQQDAAVAELEDADGEPVGVATFTEGPGGVVINVEVERGIEPGEKAIHIHETGEIEPDFEAAGDHFNPTGAEHGFDNPEGPHAGDLENIVVSGDGTASYRTVNAMITLGAGEDSILAGDGTALVIHANPDDYATDDDPETGPGMSGDRVAAGVIEASEAQRTEVPETGGLDVLSIAGLALLAVGSLLIYLRVRRSEV